VPGGLGGEVSKKEEKGEKKKGRGIGLGDLVAAPSPGGFATAGAYGPC
jgi:hypothetical protein